MFMPLPRAALLSCLICLVAALGFSLAPLRVAEANDKYASIVVDHATGKVVRSRSADKRLYPASMTKLMTLYLTFEAIEKGRLSMNSRVGVSNRAAGMEPSKLGLKAGSRVRIRDLVQALAVKSANDAAVVLAEAVARSESRFARQMTAKARQLGMRSTTFYNASGLPDRRQKSTARDIAKLGSALIRDYPEHMHFFAQRSFTYGGRTHRNTNRLLGKYPGMDGLKTGYIRASGFNLIATADQDGRRLVAVVFGGRTSRSRNDHMVRILDEGFVNARKQLGAPSAAIVSAPPPPRKPGFEVAHQAPPQQQRQGQQVIRSTAATATEQDRQPIRIIRPTRTPAAAASATAAAPTPDEQPRREVAAINTANAGYSKREGTDEAIWAVQIGVWRSVRDGRHGLDRVRSMLPDKLNHAEGVVVRRGTGRRTLYHARFLGYEQAQAEALCHAIKRRGNGCLPIIHRQ
ncbi:MAG: D-alanyl-D-alanine carboxypeptidase family protein [Alphaproteobacteria bacterium]